MAEIAADYSNSQDWNENAMMNEGVNGVNEQAVVDEERDGADEIKDGDLVASTSLVIDPEGEAGDEKHDQELKDIGLSGEAEDATAAADVPANPAGETPEDDLPAFLPDGAGATPVQGEIVSGCKGVVRRYVPNQGWGFIRNEFLGDKDVFFHANHFRSPVPEQPVHPEDGDDKTINVVFECDWKSDDKPKAFKVLVFDKEGGQLSAPVPGQVNKYGFGNGGKGSPELGAKGKGKGKGKWGKGKWGELPPISVEDEGPQEPGKARRCKVPGCETTMVWLHNRCAVCHAFYGQTFTQMELSWGKNHYNPKGAALYGHDYTAGMGGMVPENFGWDQYGKGKGKGGDYGKGWEKGKGGWEKGKGEKGKGGKYWDSDGKGKGKWGRDKDGKGKSKKGEVSEVGSKPGYAEEEPEAKRAKVD